MAEKNFLSVYVPYIFHLLSCLVFSRVLKIYYSFFNLFSLFFCKFHIIILLYLDPLPYLHHTYCPHNFMYSNTHVHIYSYIFWGLQSQICFLKCPSVWVHLLEPRQSTKSLTFKQDWLYPSQQLLVASSSSAKVVASYPFPYFYPGNFIWLELRWDLPMLHHCCEFMSKFPTV